MLVRPDIAALASRLNNGLPWDVTPGRRSAVLLDRNLSTFARSGQATYLLSASELGLAAAGERRLEAGKLLVLREHQNVMNDDPLVIAVAGGWSLQGSPAPTATADQIAAPLSGYLAARNTMGTSATSRVRDNALTLADNTTYYRHVWLMSVAGDPDTIRLRMVDKAGSPLDAGPFDASSSWGRVGGASDSGSGVTTPSCDVLNAGDANANDVYVWGYNVYAGTHWLDTILTATGTHYGDVETYTKWDAWLSTGSFQIDVWPRWADTDRVSGEELWIISIDGDQHGIRFRHDGTGVLCERVESGVVTVASGYITTAALSAAENDTPLRVHMDVPGSLIAIDGIPGATGSAGSWPTTGTLRLGGIAGGAGEVDGAVDLPVRAAPLAPP